MTLPADLEPALRTLRRELHGLAEVSGGERTTARRVAEFLKEQEPDSLVENLGGRGVAAVFTGNEPGPTVMIRCELDALPEGDGAAHRCGHDGHMAMVAGAAALLRRKPPRRGRAVLLFQPAEETGAGAGAVLRDPAFARLRPDYAFALHNLPGMPLGSVGLRSGTMACASEGIWAELRGRSSHASQPEAGLSPASAMCRVVEGWRDLPLKPAFKDRFAMVTVVHARLGNPAYGTAPGAARVMATLRAHTDEVMGALRAAARDLVRETAQVHGLEHALGADDVFQATVNAPEAVEALRDAAEGEGIFVQNLREPMPWSEDFGVFGAAAQAALGVLGAGEEHPPLHSTDYVFPDALTETGVRIWNRLIRNVLG